MKKNTSAKKVKDQRPSWDEYFIQMADFVGSRGTCDRGRSGSILVRDKRILATGYVGSPVGVKHCDEVGHEMNTVTRDDKVSSRHCVRTAHAELNAIANAARFGVAVEGATIYCKMVPCYTCAKIIINAGVERVVAAKNYHASEESKRIFKEAGIKLKILDKTIEEYKDQ